MRLNKADKLFILLGAFFITNALTAEFTGAKIFSVEKIFGIASLHFFLFGEKIVGLNMTAGVLTWPIVFIMTDIINEYYGKKGVRFLSFLAVAMIAYAYLAVWLAIEVPPADFWQFQKIGSQNIDKNLAFSLTFRQSLWIILGSLVAFLVGQLTDVLSFHFIRRKTGEKLLWLRATGSTLISQLIDSFIVLFIAFYIGSNWTITQIFAVALLNYIYKGLVAILLTPLLYLIHNLIDNYLGKELSEELIQTAAKDSVL